MRNRQDKGAKEECLNRDKNVIVFGRRDWSYKRKGEEGSDDRANDVQIKIKA